jgi:hypothetical protein
MSKASSWWKIGEMLDSMDAKRKADRAQFADLIEETLSIEPSPTTKRVIELVFEQHSLLRRLAFFNFSNTHEVLIALERIPIIRSELATLIKEEGKEG